MVGSGSPGPTITSLAGSTRFGVPAASAYHGTLGMFERAGFTVVERRQWNTTTPVRPIVRMAFGGG